MRHLYENDSVFTKSEIRLFKYLNGKKSSDKNLLELIQDMLPFLNKSKNKARYYLEIYSMNYRPNGDYENVTQENYNDVAELKPKKTSNNTAYEYASDKIPFKGSNLEGHWSVNLSGDKYYVVNSYDWYPIFLFINNQWYQVLDNYSSSTSKHISRANPIRHNSGLDSEVEMVTASEIKSIMNGESPDETLNLRVGNFVDNVGPDLIGVKKTKQIYDYRSDFSAKIVYIISDINNVDGKIIFDLKILKAGKLDGRKMVEDPELYNDQGFMNNVRKGLESELISNDRRFLTKKNTQFNFD